MSNIKDEIKDAVIGKIKDEILQHVDGIAKINNEVREEIRTAMEHIGGEMYQLDSLVYNKIEAAVKQ